MTWICIPVSLAHTYIPMTIPSIYWSPCFGMVSYYHVSVMSVSRGKQKTPDWQGDSILPLCAASSDPCGPGVQYDPISLALSAFTSLKAPTEDCRSALCLFDFFPEPFCRPVGLLAGPSWFPWLPLSENCLSLSFYWMCCLMPTSSRPWAPKWGSTVTMGSISHAP